jgi:hypothetical protein
MRAPSRIARTYIVHVQKNHHRGPSSVQRTVQIVATWSVFANHHQLAVQLQPREHALRMLQPRLAALSESEGSLQKSRARPGRRDTQVAAI